MDFRGGGPVRNGAQDLWSDCFGKVRGQISDALWRTTLSLIQPVDFDGEVLLLSVPSSLQKDRVERRIRLAGDLDEEQRARLLEIADRCPVHRTLEGEIDIRSRLE